MSVKRRQLCRPEEGKKLDTFTLGYIRAKNKNDAHSYLLDMVDNSDHSRAEIARILGKKPSQVTRWLSSSGNLTLNTLSDLIYAASGQVFELAAYDPFQQAKSNHQAIQGYERLSISSDAEFGGAPHYSKNVPLDNSKGDFYAQFSK